MNRYSQCDTMDSDKLKRKQIVCPKCKSLIGDCKFCPQCGTNVIKTMLTDFLANLFASTPASGSVADKELERQLKDDPVVAGILREMECNRKKK